VRTLPRYRASCRPRAGDLYGKTLRAALIEFIRPEMKFGGLDQLKAQIAADGEAARRLL
jgi:riboflavin kinase/FMN adenylyltransferase